MIEEYNIEKFKGGEIILGLRMNTKEFKLAGFMGDRGVIFEIDNKMIYFDIPEEDLPEKISDMFYCYKKDKRDFILLMTPYDKFDDDLIVSSSSKEVNENDINLHIIK